MKAKLSFVIFFLFRQSIHLLGNAMWKVVSQHLGAFYFILTAYPIRLLQARQVFFSGGPLAVCSLRFVCITVMLADETAPGSCPRHHGAETAARATHHLVREWTSLYCLLIGSRATSNKTVGRRRQFSSHRRKCHDKNGPKEERKATFFGRRLWMWCFGIVYSVFSLAKCLERLLSISRHWNILWVRNNDLLGPWNQR